MAWQAPCGRHGVQRSVGLQHTHFVACDCCYLLPRLALAVGSSADHGQSCIHDCVVRDIKC